MTTDQRLAIYPRFLLGALALAFGIVLVAGDGSDTASGRVGGDFPAFYSAGTIVADGEVDALWDPAVQAAAQADLLGDEDGFIMYPYPPHVAATYSVFSAVPYRLAYAVHTVLMVGLLLAALRLLRPLVSVVDRHYWAVAAAALTAYPVFVGIGGGQNTAVTLFLLALFWRGLADDREGLAGLAVALLTFRPQYALPLAGLLLLGRHRTALSTAAAGAAAVWVANAALLGPTWVTTWLREVQPLLEADAEVNARNEIAPIGFLHSLFGTDATLAVVIGGAVSAAAIATLAWIWWHGRMPLDLRIAVTTTGMLLLGPHTIYYDSSLLMFAVLILLDRRIIGVGAAAAVWALGLTHLAKGLIGGSPLALVAVGSFVTVVALAHRHGSAATPTSSPLSRVPDPGLV